MIDRLISICVQGSIRNDSRKTCHNKKSNTDNDIISLLFTAQTWKHEAAVSVKGL